MIVRILSQGKSFKGLATYLTHDPHAESADRVGWTHTLNLAQDFVPSAVDEMLWTARNSELLKQETGIRAGGRATENTVKHVSLNWSPEEAPTRAQMIEATEGFLRHMNWQDHQAVLISHTDKSHAHVHLMISTVHPETGLHLDDNFERRRAQAWALNYEQENGRVFCEQRLKNADEREDAPTRPAWMAFQKNQIEFEREENARRDQAPILVEQSENPRAANSAAWKKLKEIQRHEREVFFDEGKLEFSELRRSIYREVREEFRDRWADLYAMQKNGADAATVAEVKKELVANQKEVLEERRDDACAALRSSRDTRYRELLEDQRDTRHQMRWRQEGGLDNAIFLRAITEKNFAHDQPAPSFRSGAEEVTMRPVTEREVEGDDVPALRYGHRDERAGIKSGVDIGADLATGLGFGLLSILGGIADGLTGSTPEPRLRRTEPEPRIDLFEGAAEHARKHQQREREEAADDERRRQRSYGE